MFDREVRFVADEIDPRDYLMMDSRTCRLIVGSHSGTVYEDASDVHSLGKNHSSSSPWYVTLFPPSQ